MTNNNKIALIDGYGFVFRAYHSLPPLTRSDKTPVGAVYGFTNMLIKLLASLDVSHVAVVFDSGSKTFRNDIYPEYKANRPECPEDLKPQFPIVREAAESLNLTILEKSGVEADDIIATCAKKYSAQGHEVLIVSSDKDLMQLVDDKVHMYDAMKNKLIGINEVKEKFNVGPDRVLDILSLMGDSSDNVPGVRGIGPKGAADLINEYGSLEDIFQNIDKMKANKRRQYLEEGEENAKLSKILISLKEDVELGIELADLKVKEIDPHKLVEFLSIQGFRSLISRIKKEFNISDDQLPENPQHKSQNQIAQKSASFKEVKKIKIDNDEIISQIEQKAQENGLIIIDSFKNEEVEIFTISTAKFQEKANEIYYFDNKLNKTEPQIADDLFATPKPKQEDSNIKTDFLQKILANKSIKKIFFNAKEYLKKFDNINSYEDISVINHLLNSSIKNDLRQLIDLNLSEDFEDMGFGSMFDNKKFAEENDEKKLDFLCFKNFAIYQLYRILRNRIFAEKLNNTYLNYEIPLLGSIAKMENIGIKIDGQKLHELSAEFEKEINRLKDEIYKIAGQEFNIASPKQLGEILFEKLGLESSKKSKKTGSLSTGAKVLEELAMQGHEIANLILEFRKFSKLKNTYSDALPKEINSETNRVHSSFSSITTSTGRLSSSNPNLQNIPIRSLEGRKIRQCFIADKNHFFVSADYSQIELRVIAHIANITELQKAFKENKDIHKITAAQVFNLSEDEVDKETRSKAKAINFGIIYGISSFGLARQLNISKQEAADYIKSYLETYPGIKEYMDEYIALAKSQGYVQTISGRKCFIPQINDKNFVIRGEAERLAINAPIQGSAADIVKKAMINLDKRLIKEDLKSKIILQIHDELIVEAPKDEVEKIEKILQEEMEGIFKLKVPLKVDTKISANWQ